MTRILLYLWETYGLDALQLGLFGYFGWRILTNHFKHLKEDISEIKKNFKETNKTVLKLCERVSKVEGKIE